MAIVNGVPGFTQYPRLNVQEILLLGGEPVSPGFTVQKQIFSGSSTAASQQPSATDTALQIEFGPAQNTDQVSLAANGTITINQPGLYVFTFVFTSGRTGTSGTVRLFGRLLVDGNQEGASLFNAITNQNDGYQTVLTLSGSLSAGQVITFEIIRDSTGNNNGGLFQQDPTPAGWETTPSAKVTCSSITSSEELTTPTVQIAP